MAEPAKKFSLVFTKTSKKPNFAAGPKNVEKKDRQLIDCLEGKLIKVKGVEEKVEEKQIIIPLQPNQPKRVVIKSENGEATPSNDFPSVQRTESSQEITIKQEPLDDTTHVQPTEESGETVKIKKEPVDTRPATLEEIAAQEILKEAEELQKKGEGGVILSLPTVGDTSVLGTDPTNEDYEKIPVSAFGMGMLKGMGWQEETGVGKKPQLVARVETKGPKRFSGVEQARGAAKIGASSAANAETEEDLELVTGAFVKVLNGRMKGAYGEVEGFTDLTRVIVKMVIRGGTAHFDASLLEVVSKREYLKNSRVLNVSKYEEVKNKVTKSLEDSNLRPPVEKSGSSSDDSSDEEQRKPSKLKEEERRSPSPPQRKKSPPPEPRRDRIRENQDKRGSSGKSSRRSPSSSPDSRYKKSEPPRGRNSPSPPPPSKYASKKSKSYYDSSKRSEEKFSSSKKESHDKNKSRGRSVSPDSYSAHERRKVDVKKCREPSSDSDAGRKEKKAKKRKHKIRSRSSDSNDSLSTSSPKKSSAHKRKKSHKKKKSRRVDSPSPSPERRKKSHKR